MAELSIGLRNVNDRTIALCCRCGELRVTSARGGTGEPTDWGDPRCMVRRKCAHCGQQTMHAYLRKDEFRDYMEQEDRMPGHPDRWPER